MIGIEQHLHKINHLSGCSKSAACTLNNGPDAVCSKLNAGVKVTHFQV